MKKAWVLLVTAVFTSQLWGQIVLPESRTIAGPLNPILSEFGDEFFNFPPEYMGMAEPGSTFLSGWVEFRFEEPEGGEAEFIMTYHAVGTADGIIFPGGQFYTLLENRALNNPLFANRGILDLQTGEISELELHAIFRNTVIAQVTRNIRIPFGFINDYPPVALPVDLPFDDEPTLFADGVFTTSAGQITGFEFHGETAAPVTLFPQLGLFPPYSFAEQERFYFANPEGCVEGTPLEQCLSPETHPSGVLLPQEAFFHPHFDLVTHELRPVPEQVLTYPCASLPLTDVNGLVAMNGSAYLMGGFDGGTAFPSVLRLDTASSSWIQEGDPMPFPVVQAQSAAVGNRIYVVGGLDLSTGNSTRHVQVFDTVAKSWSSAPDALFGVYDGVAAAVGDRVHVLTGSTETIKGRTFASSGVQSFDTASQEWALGRDAPQAVTGAAAGVVGSTIFVINGKLQDERITRQTWIYETSDDSWTEGPATEQAVLDAAAVHLAGRIYLVSGRTAPGAETLPILQILVLEKGEWRGGLEPDLATAGGAAIALDGKIFVVGGRTRVGTDSGPGVVNDFLQVYDPARGWSACNSHPVFQSTGVLSAACGAVGPDSFSPGSRVLVVGRHLAPSTRTAPPLRYENGRLTSRLPLGLNGVRVRVDGKPAPLLEVGPNLLEFQIPYTVSARTGSSRQVSVEVVRAGFGPHPPVHIPVRAAAPTIFTYHFDEFFNKGYLSEATGIIRNEDGTINSPSQPASAGEKITVQMTGLGAVSPRLGNGERAGVGHAPLLLPQVFIEGIEVPLEAVNLRARDIGIYDIEVIIPADSPLHNNVVMEVVVNEIRSNKARVSVR